MTFFNRKEDVLDIQLTQYGKHLLSKGVFKPSFYAFFDDDVLYDGAHGGLTEHQNDIEGRIKETPRMRTQHLFHGVETRINSSINYQIQQAAADDALDTSSPDITLPQSQPEKHFANALPLGNSALGIQNATSFDIKFLKGYFTGSNSISSNDKAPNIRIPQVHSEMVYETFVQDDSQGFRFFDDGTAIGLEENYIVIEVEEDNSFRLNKNFDIEIYKIEDQYVDGVATGEEILIPLSFPRESFGFNINEDNIYSPNPGASQNGSEISLLASDPIADIDLHDNNVPQYDDSTVEYFFNIEVDNEIDAQLMCELKPVDKAKGIFADRIFDCQDADEDLVEDIYGAQEEYEDPCE